jgi:hypothetical protein
MIKKFESFNKEEDDKMNDLIARATKFEQEMKKRPIVKSKIQLGDTVCIGKKIRPKNNPNASYNLFDGKYYRCTGVNPVTLKEYNKNKEIILTDKEYTMATKENSYWVIYK